MMDDVCMKVPNYSCVIARGMKGMPQFLKDFIDDHDGFACELTDAYLPHADSKASECIRVFGDSDTGEIEITNKEFSYIERSDYTCIHHVTNTDKDGKTLNYEILSISKSFSEDTEIEGFILKRKEVE